MAPSLTRKNLAARKLVEKRRDSIKHYICEDLPKEREGERRREKEREGERRREKEREGALDQWCVLAGQRLVRFHSLNNAG